MSDAITVVEGLDFVVSLAAGHLHPDDLEAARATATTARTRAGHLGTTMVLALVGGTGSGKSSLLNKLVARKQLARTSSTPGKTRLVHWYEVERTAGPVVWLVDD